MTTLDGTAIDVDLGSGYSISAPGLTGEAVVRLVSPGASRGGAASPIDAALAAHGMEDVAEIELDVTGELASSGSRANEEVAVEIPDLGDTVGQLILAVDDATGLLSWQLPEPSQASSPTRGGTRRVVLRGQSLASSAGGATRGWLGWVGKKLLRVLVYPVTDAATGWMIDKGISAWESKARPHGVRLFGPAAHRSPAWKPIDGAEWNTVTRGKALLFVHGTFSTGAGAFGALSDDEMRSLAGRYGGRVIAFEHPTITATPEENAQWLAQELATHGVALDADIVCHSRGGLVSRFLAERIAAPSSRLRVGRLVLVGVPNAGTPLVDPEHMTTFLDTTTNLASGLLGASSFGDVLDAVLAVVKVLGRGLLIGSSGLASMNPNGPLVKLLNDVAVDAAEYYAVCSDLEPTGTGPGALALKVLDAGVDQVFGGPNDAVVPTLGMHTAGGMFVEPARRLELTRAESVLHTKYFGSPRVAARLQELLIG